MSEQTQAYLDKRKAVAEELRKKIAHAGTWSQIFSSPEKAQTDFIERIVGDFKDEYAANGSLKGYFIEENPDGDIHRFDRFEKGHFATAQRLVGGDVIMTFNSSGEKPSIDRIIPGSGNIDHSFTLADTISPSMSVIFDLIKDPEMVSEIGRTIGADVVSLFAYLRGKPATIGWENVMLENGKLPQRIGHRIYPSFALEAQRKIRGFYPHLMLQPK